MRNRNFYSGNARILRELIEEDYDAFKHSILQLDGASIFELAPRVAAVEEVYFYMTTRDWVELEDADNLLSAENPLLLLADEWQEQADYRAKDFGQMLGRIAEKYDDDYECGTVADELWEQYGKYTPPKFYPDFCCDDYDDYDDDYDDWG